LVLRAAIRLGTRGGARIARGLGEAGSQAGEELGNKLDSAIKNSFDTALKPLLDVLTVISASLAIATFKYLKGLWNFFTNPLKTIAGLVTDTPIGEVAVELAEDIGEAIDKADEEFDRITDGMGNMEDATSEATDSLDEFATDGEKLIARLKDQGLTKMEEFALRSALVFAGFETDSTGTIGTMVKGGLSLFETFKQGVIQVFQDILDMRTEANNVFARIDEIRAGLTGPQDVIDASRKFNVDDAIITKDGQVIQTNPEDTIIATQSPQNIGGAKNFIFNGMVPEQVIEFVKKELAKDGFAHGRF